MDEISSMEDQTRNDFVETFDEMPLNQSLLRGIYECGFEKPSPIQQRVIVPMINGEDILVEGFPQTGKTVSFAVATLQCMDFSLRNTLQALVLLPTHELAQKTHKLMAQLARFLPDAASHIRLLGYGNDFCMFRPMSPGCVIAVGTPGIVLHLLKRDALQMKNLKTLILDEAFELMAPHLKNRVDNVFHHLPPEVQIAFFTVTISSNVLKMSQRFMRFPTTIRFQDSFTFARIQRFYVNIDEYDKLGAIMELYESVPLTRSVIFTSTRQRVAYITQKLIANDLKVSSIHPDMTYTERQDAMDSFNMGESHVLVTTDLTTRYIDGQKVNTVINFNLPGNQLYHSYRIGCIGYPQKGIVFYLVCPRDMQALRGVELHYHKCIRELPEGCKLSQPVKLLCQKPNTFP